LGACALGELGKPSEKVGEEAAAGMIASVASGAALDKHMADQIIPFMALARDRSTVTVEEVTDHAKVNMGVVEAMLGVEFVINENNKTISVDGVGYQRKM
jgi:RNA 3'-terminal phosphate cyclase